MDDNIENIKWKYAILYIIYCGNDKIGYTTSENEADLICEKCPELQWNKSKNINLIKTLEQTTINNFQ
jgi:hypothetical protein